VPFSGHDRLTPKRPAYWVESTHGGEVWVVVRIWPNEELALSDLKALRAAEEVASPRLKGCELPPSHPRLRFH
jgi:hypothetical protein